MMFEPSPVSLIVSVFSLGIGVFVFWAQPARFTNQAFLLLAILTAAVFGCAYGADLASKEWQPGEVGPLYWLRTLNAIVSFSPWVLWLLKEAIASGEAPSRDVLRKTLPWLGISTMFAAFCFTDGFFRPRYTPGLIERTDFAWAFGFSIFAAHLFLAIQAARQLRQLSGIRRVEMQFLVVGTGVVWLLGTALSIATLFSDIPEFRRQTRFVVFAGYVLTAWAVAYHRIFDVRQVLLSLGQRAAVALGLGLAIVGLRHLFSGLVPEPLDLWLGIAVAVPFVPWFDRQTQAWLRLSGEKIMAEWRAAALTLSRAEASPQKLAAGFETLLRERCGATFATLLFRTNNGYAAGPLAFAGDRPGHGELVRVGWATPESLLRRRQSAALEDLAQFLTANALGVVVAIPQGSPSPALLVAVGVKANQWPFTYPEVQRLQGIGELMDNILTHSRLTADAALEAKMQHLAMMSRGLAHDLKNLITPIASFLVHTDGKFEAVSAEAEVHAAAKRSVRRMTDYVNEALFFSSRLKPRLERTEVSVLFDSVRELCGARAASREIQLAISEDGPVSLLADTVLLQRLLGNLVNNALDASAPGQVVTLRCTGAGPGRVRFEIADDGGGIPPENLARIFEPYFTTKQFGDDVRGFGLGLTICEKIVSLHQGTILVRSEPGHGTSVIVELPETPADSSPTAPPAAPA